MSGLDLSGKTLAGKYLLKRLLGEGGMGSVYEGEHVEIGKRVAIKVIHPENATSETVAERFRREARAASAVESDGIVHVFDVGRDPSFGLYMVMELLAGEDLDQRLKREGGLDPAVALSFGLQAARALGAAHAAGVIHRDLKPANLFLCVRDDGSIKVKLLDFGISKILGGSEKDRSQVLTRQGSVVGTPQYMSPEQAQGLTVDARTDVWSLGAVLFEAIAGRPVFPAKATYEQTIIQVVTQRPPRLEDVVPGVPADIARVVHEALEPFVEERIPDGAALARRLAEVMGGEGALAMGAAVFAGSPRSAMPSRPNASPTGEGLTVGKPAMRRLPLGLVVAGVSGVVLAAAIALVTAVVMRPKPAAEGFALAPSALVTAPVATAPVATAPVATAPVAPAPVATAPAATAPVAPADAALSLVPAASISVGPSSPSPARPRPHPSPAPKPPATKPTAGQIGGAGTTSEY